MSLNFTSTLLSGNVDSTHLSTFYSYLDLPSCNNLIKTCKAGAFIKSFSPFWSSLASSQFKKVSAAVTSLEKYTNLDELLKKIQKCYLICKKETGTPLYYELGFFDHEKSSSYFEQTDDAWIYWEVFSSHQLVNYISSNQKGDYFSYYCKKSSSLSSAKSCELLPGNLFISFNKQTHNQQMNIYYQDVYYNISQEPFDTETPVKMVPLTSDADNPDFFSSSFKSFYSFTKSGNMYHFARNNQGVNWEVDICPTKHPDEKFVDATTFWIKETQDQKATLYTLLQTDKGALFTAPLSLPFKAEATRFTDVTQIYSLTVEAKRSEITLLFKDGTCLKTDDFFSDQFEMLSSSSSLALHAWHDGKKDCILFWNPESGKAHIKGTSLPLPKEEVIDWLPPTE